ncbi:MAG: hypothetical protein H6741_21950 [Alphaproteobacteria bacterium]|nr:hypothetical protein [Alphaproteobacteria bacterium]MCB9795376.1 hypothetical protein [Alphaproteobacteria bacterium]
MTTPVASRKHRLLQALDLTAPESQLYIVFDPAAATAWGWGYTPEAAQASALDRMQEVDAVVHPCPRDESARDHLDRCEVMRVGVAQRYALDLLAMLDLVLPAQPSNADS